MTKSLKPEICPICNTGIELPPGVRYASVQCMSCCKQLWCINRPNGDSFYFDSDDASTFIRERDAFRNSDRIQFSENGWHEITDTKGQALYDRFVEKRNFFRAKDKLISVPDHAIGVDMSDLKLDSDNTSIELQTRSCLLKAFEANDDIRCNVIDVNHSEYTFDPTQVKAESVWPISILVSGEYLAFNNFEFSHGLFCNPRNGNLVCYGDSFVDQFSKTFRGRLTSAETAVQQTS